MPVPELVECAEEAGTPLLLADERSSVAINVLHNFLDDRLAPRIRLHGVLVDVFGVGLLLGFAFLAWRLGRRLGPNPTEP